ncbi:MAG: transglycosylase SLT domain-containing protein [Aeromonas sobria]
MTNILKLKVSWVNALLIALTFIYSHPVLAIGWSTILNNFQLTKVQHADINRHMDSYAGQLTNINMLVNNAAPIMVMIADHIYLRGLPSDLIFLPFIESGYNPYAISPVGATGLWQLMPATATQYGVIRNEWFDGRRDITSSTSAALDYLSYLHRLFHNDWLLALAAYNAGEGRVSKAIEYNKSLNRSTDFWSLPLPAETREYVPKFLALVRLLAMKKIVLPSVSSQQRLVKASVNGGINLVNLAQAAGISNDILLLYNAGFEQPQTPANSNHTLLYPATVAIKVKKYLARHGTVISGVSHSETDIQQQIAARNQATNEALKKLGWAEALLKNTTPEFTRPLMHPATLQHSSQSAATTLSANHIEPSWHKKIAPITEWHQQKPAEIRVDKQ